MNNETRVGMLFFAAIGAALWYAVTVGKLGGGEGAYEIRFNRCDGLKAGDGVHFNGVDVGTIRDVRPVLDADGVSRVAVRFDLDPDKAGAVTLNERSSFNIGKGLLGGARLDIRTDGRGTPVSPDALTGRLGSEPADLDAFFREAALLVRENRENLKEAIARLPTAIDNMGAMGAEVRKLVADNQQAVNEAVVAMRDMGRSVTSLVQENRASVDTALASASAALVSMREILAENRADIRATIGRLPQASEDLAATLREIRGLVERNQGRVDGIIERLASFAPKLDQMGTDGAKITQQIASGQGSVGRLVFSDDLHNQASKALGGVEARADELKDFTAPFATTEFYGGAFGEYNTRSEVTRGGAFLRIQPAPWKFYEGGVTYISDPAWADDEQWLYDYFALETAIVGPQAAYLMYDYRKQQAEDDRRTGFKLLNPDIILGWRFWSVDDWQRYRLTLRGGLIEGHLGAKAEWALSESLTAGLLLRMPDHAELPNGKLYEPAPVMGRAWAEWTPWRRISLLGGVDDLFYKPGGFVGLRAEILDQDIRNLLTARISF